MKTFFSIIIPVYNVAPYLCECLDSVLAQAFTDWECLCVDDGSTDGSGDILDEYAEKDKRFRVFHTENGGVSSARNLALDNANGEWVWCVDGDDIIHPSALNHIVGVLSSSSVDAYAYSGYLSGESIGGDIHWPNLDAASAHIQNSKDLESYMAFKSACWSVLHRRKLFRNIRYQPFARSEDVLFNTSLFWACHTFAIDNAVLYFYRQRNDSARGSPLNAVGEGDDLKAKRIIIDIEREHKEVFAGSNALSFRNWRRRTSLAGDQNRFLCLRNSEKSKIMKTWLELQRSAIKAGYGYRDQKFSVSVCSVFPFGWVSDKCIRFILRLNGRSFFCAATSFAMHRLGFQTKR